MREKPTSSVRRRLLMTGLAACPLVLAGLAAGVLLLGNPQRSRYVYMFQAYVWPKYPFGDIPPPPGYTGVWRTWDRNGRIVSEAEYEGGNHNGVYTLWSITGQKWEEGRFANDLENGQWTAWDYQGNVVAQGTFKNGLPWEGTFLDFDETEGVSVIKRYADGVQVSVRPRPGSYPLRDPGRPGWKPLGPVDVAPQ